jgi:hypothetical protein
MKFELATSLNRFETGLNVILSASVASTTEQWVRILEPSASSQRPAILTEVFVVFLSPARKIPE